MPTVLRVGPHSFVFFSSDRTEPPHIHVKRDRKVAKYWLDPVALAKSKGVHCISPARRIECGNLQSLICNLP